METVMMMDLTVCDNEDCEFVDVMINVCFQYHGDNAESVEMSSGKREVFIVGKMHQQAVDKYEISILAAII